MWTSGEFEWARDQPIPSQTHVYYWLKNSRRERPAKIGNKKHAPACSRRSPPPHAPRSTPPLHAAPTRPRRTPPPPGPAPPPHAPHVRPRRTPSLLPPAARRTPPHDTAALLCRTASPHTRARGHTRGPGGGGGGGSLGGEDGE